VGLYLLRFRLQLTCHLLPPRCCWKVHLLQFAWGASHPPIPAGFVYFRFSWAPASPLFSSVESYQLAKAAVLVYLEFVWGTSLPPLSGGACHTSATVSNLAHPKLGGRGHQTHLQQACLFTVHADARLSFSRAQGALPSLLHVFFNSLFIIQFFFFVGWRSVSPGSYLVYPRRGCGDTMCRLFAHLLVCISQAG
jgi:hypothetical protein